MLAKTKHKDAITHLQSKDAVIARVIDHIGDCRIKRAPSHFLSLVEAIVWQQLSYKAALTIHRRMLDVLGSRKPTPEDFLHVRPAALHAAGLSRRKAEYLIGLAEYFHSGEFPQRRLGRMNDEEVIDELVKVRGIGRWSAEMFLMFALNRPDVFPAGDLGLRNAIKNCYGLRKHPSDRRLAEISRPWRPYRTIASWYLWAAADGVPFK